MTGSEPGHLADEACERLQAHWAAGERVPVEHFLRLNPELTADSEAVLEILLLEVALREEAGENVTLAEVIARFPEFESALRLQMAFRAGIRDTSKPRSVFGAEPTGPIHGYEIGREIGRGGMGTVYEALQLSLNRRVALKMVTIGGLNGAAPLARMTVEAEAVSRLQHPNVVQIFEVGEHEGRPFLALELVEGGTLADRLRIGPLAPKEAAKLVETLGLAVHAAHERGIVHRDLKPSNVLFTLSTGPADPGIPKLTDFGLAKLLDAGVQSTRSGDTIGTPGYMSPEQITGASRIGPGADVYGLGSILYECLTGLPPFRGTTVAEILFQVSQTEPLPLSRLRGAIPRDIQTICMKCLEKQPRRRYGSALALAEELSRFQRGEPVLARPLGKFGRLLKHARRRPLVAGLLFALVAVVVTGLVVVTWKWQEATQQAAEKSRQRDKAETNLYRTRIAQAALLWQSNDHAAAKDHLRLCVPEPGLPDPRGWEWHYLNRLFNSELATLSHRYWVRGLAVSPDGRELAVACGDPKVAGSKAGQGEIVVWDFQTHTLLWRIEVEDTASVSYSPDGRHLVAVLSDGAVRLIDRTTRRVRFPWAPQDSVAIGVAFNDRGSHIALISGNPARVVVRNLETGEVEPGPHDLLGSWPTEAIVVAGGIHVLVNEPGQPLRVVHRIGTAARKELVEIAPQALAVLGETRLAAVGMAGGAILDLESKRETRRLHGHFGMICAAATSPDGTILATGGADQTVRLWDPATAQEKLVLRGHVWTVQALAFSPDGQYLVTGGQDRTVKIWEVSRNPRGQMLACSGWVNGVAFTNDGRVRASTAGGRIGSWSIAGGQLAEEGVTLPDMTAKRQWPRCFAEFFQDGRRIVSISESDPKVPKVWDIETGKALSTFPGHAASVQAVAVSPDGRWIAAAARKTDGDGGGGEIRVWETATGTSRAVFPVPYTHICSLAISPDGRQVAIGAGGVTDSIVGVMLWDLESNTRIAEIAEHRLMVTSLAYSPDGRHLASIGLNDRQLLLIDAANGKIPHRYTTVNSPTRVAFHPSGRRLAVIGYEGVVSLRDGVDGTEIMRLTGLVGNWNGDIATDARVCFSPDGNWLVSTNWNGSINVWDGRAAFDSPSR